MFFVVLLSTSSQMWRQSVHKCGDSLYTNVETVCTQMWRQSVHKCGDSLYTNQATTASCYILSNSLFSTIRSLDVTCTELWTALLNNYKNIGMRYLHLTFIGPCVVIYSYSTTNKMRLLSEIIYSCTTLCIFRRVFPSIIRSSELRIQQRFMSNSCCYLLLYLTFIGSCISKFMGG